MLFPEGGRQRETERGGYLARSLVTAPFLGVRGNVFRRQAIFFGGRKIYAAITDEGRTEDSGEGERMRRRRKGQQHARVEFSVGGSPHRDSGTSLGQHRKGEMCTIPWIGG